MVMCDEHYLPHIKHLPFTHFHITSKNDTAMMASIRKTEIFNFEHIDQYDKVLFLDCDVTVNSDTTPLFDAIVRDDVLYVVRNCDNIGYYKGNGFGCTDDPYDEKTLAIFDKNHIYGFNAGQYGFCVSDKMRLHFHNVSKSIERFDPSIHFYEQSFMNSYFNRILAIDYAIERFVWLNGRNKPPTMVLYHICGANIPFIEKLKIMKREYGR